MVRKCFFTGNGYTFYSCRPNKVCAARQLESHGYPECQDQCVSWPRVLLCLVCRPWWQGVSAVPPPGQALGPRRQRQGHGQGWVHAAGWMSMCGYNMMTRPQLSVIDNVNQKKRLMWDSVILSDNGNKHPIKLHLPLVWMCLHLPSDCLHHYSLSPLQRMLPSLPSFILLHLAALTIDDFLLCVSLHRHSPVWGRCVTIRKQNRKWICPCSK